MRFKPLQAIVVFTLLSIISCRSRNTLFTPLTSSETNIQFTNIPERHKGFNILYYLYYYNGGGVATGDINNDGLPDIYFTANNKGGNKLFLNKGNLKFEDITASAGVAGTSDWCSGVTMADVNGDGFLDIYVAAISKTYNLNGHNELFLNDGKGHFTESAAKYGLDFSGMTCQTAFFDYDHDGDLDCYILNESKQPHANIVDTSNRHKIDSISGDRLYRNDMNQPAAKFTDVSVASGIYQSNLGYGLGISVADINNDGWEDIYIGNDFHENDYYYINNHNGTFTENGAKHFNHYSRFSMGNDVADYNNDGQLDVVTVDMLPSEEKILKTYGSDENPDIYKVKLELNGYQYQYSKNSLQRNNGNGESFSETSLLSGVSATDWSWSPLFADFDNDGNKDLFISSGIVKRPVDLDYVRFVSDMQRNKGLDQTDKYDDEAINAMPDGSNHPYFFKGQGDLKFADKSTDWGTGDLKGFYNGASYADLDNDGDLDVVMNCLQSEAVILKNNSVSSNYLTLQFKGETANTQGIGAKAYLFNGGKFQYQQLMLTRGFQSSSEPRLHFGLDKKNTADSILIVWPDQRYQILKNVKTNQSLQIEQKNASAVFDYASFFPSKKAMFEDVTASTMIAWKHQENDFVDFNRQYLIPHAESTRGPRMAVADIDNDGLDDIYVCGSEGHSGVMLKQTKSGVFESTNNQLFSSPVHSDEVDALFFDANNDGFKDLYVVHGGNEQNNGDSSLADQLFFNNGKGQFVPSSSSLPKQMLINKSCVTAADIDKDGDNDLFVGGFLDASKYGMPQSSFLLLNDGKGQFSTAPSSTIALDTLGMVTTASFTDINKDGWPDLLVTGEWMPVKLFINNKGVFTTQDVPQSTGLWQSALATDINGDGFADILAGNWGHNTKLYAGKNGPAKLYVKDFDKNGSVEQIMAYTIDGKEYTFLAKDELERPLPVLKKAYLKYGDVAGKTVDYMFYDLFKDYKELKAEVLGSSCFINDGKGKFTRTDLPDGLQVSPIFSFTEVPGAAGNSFLAAGNFYGVTPYEGRYDGLYPTLFSYTKNSNTFTDGSIQLHQAAEYRDMKWVSTGTGKKLLVLGKNNGGLIFLKPTE